MALNAQFKSFVDQIIDVVQPFMTAEMTSSKPAILNSSGRRNCLSRIRIATECQHWHVASRCVVGNCKVMPASWLLHIDDVISSLDNL